MNFEKKKIGLAAKISAAMVLGVGFMGVMPSVVPNSRCGKCRRNYDRR